MLCYAHFDVQPPDPLDLWESPPFELTHRDGRLYARGVADDKGNLFVTRRGGRGSSPPRATLPVNVRFAFDGEEEIGGDSIVDWVEQDERGADAALILDGAMIRRDQPAFTSAFAGWSISTSASGPAPTDMHSGMFGAAALNATHALMTALASVIPGADGRLPDELRAGVDSSVGRGARGLGAAAFGGGAARAAGRRADRAGRCRTSSTSARSRTRRST